VEGVCSTTKIRMMDVRDIPSAVRLTGSEGWGFTAQDFRRLLQLDPQGCFIASDRHRRVGLITTTSYDSFAWIGNVIVAESARGRGVATELIGHAISHIESRGIKRVGLYSYLETRSLYKKFSFVERMRFLRYVGTTGARDKKEARSLARDRLSEIVRFDRDRFGANRKNLLELLYREFPHLCFVLEDRGRIEGYVMAKGAQFGYEVGPWVCDHSVIGLVDTLLNAELKRMGKGRVEVTVPKRNRIANHALVRSGFSPVGEVAQMFRGGFPKCRDDTIFAIGALEKG